MKHYMMMIVPCADCLKLPREFCDYFAMTIIRHSLKDLKRESQQLGNMIKGKHAVALSQVFECTVDGEPIEELGRLEEVLAKRKMKKALPNP